MEVQETLIEYMYYCNMMRWAWWDWELSG